jgi:hypothetical protein
MERRRNREKESGRTRERMESGWTEKKKREDETRVEESTVSCWWDSDFHCCRRVRPDCGSREVQCLSVLSSDAAAENRTKLTVDASDSNEEFFLKYVMIVQASVIRHLR